MARGATKRNKQAVRAAKTAAPKRGPSRGARRQSRHTYEQAMFFPMLRRRAKWVFVLLAFAFIIGFVVFGVGTGTGGAGLGDLFNGSNSTAKGPSATDARKKLAANPNDAAAWNELANASLTSGDTSTAINALQHYTLIKQKNTGAFIELAGLYQRRATNLTTSIQATQNQAGAVTPNSFLQPQLISPGTKKHPGRPVLGTPVIDSTLSTTLNSRLTTLETRQRTDFTKAEAAYRTVVRLQPKNAQVQLDLASVAQQSGDITTEIAALKRYLRLAPASPQARLVQRQLRLLQPAAVTPSKRKAKH